MNILYYNIYKKIKIVLIPIGNFVILFCNQNIIEYFGKYIFLAKEYFDKYKENKQERRIHNNFPPVKLSVISYYVIAHAETFKSNFGVFLKT